VKPKERGSPSKPSAKVMELAWASLAKPEVREKVVLACQAAGVEQKDANKLTPLLSWTGTGYKVVPVFYWAPEPVQQRLNSDLAEVVAAQIPAVWVGWTGYHPDEIPGLIEERASGLLEMLEMVGDPRLPAVKAALEIGLVHVETGVV